MPVLAAPTPASAQIAVGVGLSVNIGPPALPVYVQPPAPAPNLIWAPGYWGWGLAGYCSVPGTWVAAPQPGYLWTPGYWGYSGGYYAWHGGYWGPHIGFYGGVNYGAGYFGVGYVGGGWYGNTFRYNTAVTNVNTTVIHNTYVNNTVIVNNNTTVSRVSYNGGPGGVQAQPNPEERNAMQEEHVPPTQEQNRNVLAAHDRNNLASVNHGQIAPERALRAAAEQGEPAGRLRSDSQRRPCGRARTRRFPAARRERIRRRVRAHVAQRVGVRRASFVVLAAPAVVDVFAASAVVDVFAASAIVRVPATPAGRSSAEPTPASAGAAFRRASTRQITLSNRRNSRGFQGPARTAAEMQLDAPALSAILGRSLSAGDYADAFYERRVSRSFRLQDGRIHEAGVSLTSGVGVRVISGERAGYAHTGDLSPDSLRNTARVAALIAKDRNAGTATAPISGDAGARGDYYGPLEARRLRAVSSTYVELLERADAAARAFDPRIVAVNATISDELQDVWIPTSDGALVSDRRPLVTLFVQCVAKGAVRANGTCGDGGRTNLDFFAERTPEAIAREAARIATVNCRGDPSAGRRDGDGRRPRRRRRAPARSGRARAGKRFQPPRNVALQRPRRRTRRERTRDDLRRRQPTRRARQP